MACACKNKVGGQVTAVKQVVKKVPTNINSTTAAAKRPVVKRVMYRRPI